MGGLGVLIEREHDILFGLVWFGLRILLGYFVSASEIGGGEGGKKEKWNFLFESVLLLLLLFCCLCCLVLSFSVYLL